MPASPFDALARVAEHSLRPARRKAESSETFRSASSSVRSKFKRYKLACNASKVSPVPNGQENLADSRATAFIVQVEIFDRFHGTSSAERKERRRVALVLPFPNPP